MALPFAVRHGDGITWVERAKDEAFRKALLDGVPVSVRPKMREALNALPDNGARAHSMRYFGADLDEIKGQIAPLLIELNKFLTEQRRLPGLFDWLDVTNYGNDYRMIKAFKAWSELITTVPNG